jgi:DNA-directed RNA polymerase II subunit RPB1
VVRQVYGAIEVEKILRRITDEDAEILGFCPKFNRPEWMICTVLPVPPPCVRPSVRNDTGVRKEDDLTHKLSDIIKYNAIVKDKIVKGASYDTIEWHTSVLQQHVATLIDNTGSFVSKDRTGRVFRTICDRLNRKEGRIRGNLMGKRVDFSARTVITPDPNISIDELGVPIKIAMNLTFPEVVNRFNIDEMYRYVRNGPDVYPGAKHIRKGSRTIRLRGNNRESLELVYGDIVERHLLNGDYVLFNRQPSLHKMSMMAHRVRVMPHNTFRLNVCVCASYNADFDGDEMNMHVPQSLQSHEEIVQLAAVPLHIISPRHSRPIISIVQDVALGVFRITQSHVSVSEKQFYNLVCSNPVFTGLPRGGRGGAWDDGEEVGERRWTGRQLLSTIIPPTTIISMYLDDKKPDAPDYVAGDHHVSIRCGELLSGVLTTHAFKEPATGLLRSIVNDGGPDTVTVFLNNTQKLICDWLLLSGFSVGISDLVAPTYKRRSIKEKIAEMHEGVSKKIASLHAGEIKNVSTHSNSAFFESEIDRVTRTCIDQVEKVALGEIDVRSNRMLNMIKSGSKGEPLNFMQILACLGQQVIDGRRIPDGFDQRTLPHFTKYDDGPTSRGFVEHSFVEGLTPEEFFFHSMAGRVGLIDTAVRTSETGYIQRRLVTFMQDLKVHIDLTVRNSAGQIVQFLYGEDGIDATHVEYQVLPSVEMDVPEVVQEHLVADTVELRGLVLGEVLAAEPVDAGRMAAHVKKLLADREFAIRVNNDRMDGEVMYAVNVSTMVMKAHELLKMSKNRIMMMTDLHPHRVLDAIEGLIKELVCSAYGCSRFMAMLLRYHLSPKQLIRKGFTCAVLDFITRQIRVRFFESIAHPGEMVGILAAQSIGEPTTQTTLNTFHLAGVGAASITTQQGVPRLQELFGVSKKMKTPYMKIFLREPWNTDMSRCRDVCSEVQTTRFRDVVRQSKVYYDPSPQAVPSNNTPPPPTTTTTIAGDRGLIRAFNKYTLQTDPICASEGPWVLRFEFDRSKLLELQVNMLDLEIVLREFYDDTITCTFSDDNSAELVARIRLNAKGIHANDILTELRALEENILDTVVIKGVKNIDKAVPVKPNGEQLVFDPITSTFVKRSEWVVETSGTNLTQVLALPHVDPVRTWTNDINEVYQVLGIEAARQALYNELTAVMNQKNNSVNYRHMALLVDAMTSRGTLTSVSRHGINKGDIGPLAKCSFERTTEMLIQAGVFADMDRINGVAANIMLGQVAPCGTGDSEIYIDDAALQAQGHEVALPEEEAHAGFDRGGGADARIMAAAAAAANLDRHQQHNEAKAQVPNLPDYAAAAAAEATIDAAAATVGRGVEVSGDELELF